MVQQTKPQINNQPKNKTAGKLPVWLMNSERHQVPLTKGRLVQDNLSKFAALVAFLTRITPVYSAKNSPWVRIVELIGLTILIVLSSQVMFLWLMLILMLVHLLILPGSVIITISKKLCKLLLVSLVVLLPSLLLQANNIGLFLARIALIMLNISIFLSITSWPQFIQGLKQLHLPNVIILTLDITMKYVYTLGVYIQELLSSIKLRTFGQHVNRRVLGVIIGQVYLSAKKRTSDLYQAMLLRGYNSNNVASWRLSWNKYDVISMGELLLAIVAYCLIRGVVA